MVTTQISTIELNPELANLANEVVFECYKDM